MWAHLPLVVSNAVDESCAASLSAVVEYCGRSEVVITALALSDDDDAEVMNWLRGCSCWGVLTVNWLCESVDTDPAHGKEEAGSSAVLLLGSTCI